MYATLTDFGSVLTRWRTWKLMADLDIRMRYKRSVIGPFWISMSMAIMLLGMATLFSAIFQSEFRPYLLYLGSGMLVWTFLTTMIQEGCGIAIEAEGQLRNIAIPMPVLAARMVYRNFLIFLHNALVVALEFWLLGALPGPGGLAAIPGLAMVIATGYFSALTLGPICLRFRDVTQVVASVFQFLFFLTPIIWRPEQGRVAPIVIEVNPIYHILQLVRAPLYGKEATQLDWAVASGTVGFLLVTALISLYFSRRRLFLWL